MATTAGIFKHEFERRLQKAIETETQRCYNQDLPEIDKETDALVFLEWLQTIIDNLIDCDIISATEHRDFEILINNAYMQIEQG